MKLLHIIATVDPASGGPIEGLRRQNEVTQADVLREVVSLDPPSSSFLEAFPMPVHALGREESGFFRRYGYTPDLVPWLRKNSSQYDAVIVHGLWNYVALGASLVLPARRVPYFVFTHGMMDPWFRKAYPLKHWAKQLFWWVGEGRLLAGARRVFFTCEEEMRQARGVFLGHRYREEVVGYGAVEPPAATEAQAAAFRAATPGIGERRFILFLSRIHPKKGCDLLVEAFAGVAADFPDIDLVVAGPDATDWRPKLEALAARNGVSDRIHWPGPLFGEAKWGAMRSAEAFILPSHQENFGIAVAEALACGTPVLISDKVNIWREVESSGAGLVAPDDLAGTKSLLQQFLSLEPSARAKMGERARATFEQFFNVKNTAPALVKTIRDIIAS